MHRTQGQQGPGVKGAGVGLEGVSAWPATGLRALWEERVVSSFPPHPQPGFGFQVFNPLPSTSQCLSWSKQRPPQEALAPGLRAESWLGQAACWEGSALLGRRWSSDHPRALRSRPGASKSSRIGAGQCSGLWVTVNWALHPGSVGSLYRVSL